MIDFPALLRFLKRPLCSRLGGLRVLEVGPLHLRQLAALAHAREDVQQTALAAEDVPPQTQGCLNRLLVLGGVLSAVHFAYHILSQADRFKLSEQAVGRFSMY